MNYKTKIPKEILEYIELVETEEVRVCKWQKDLIKYVKKVFRTEELFVNEEQIEKYLSYQKYFPYELFAWEKFVFVLHNCVYDLGGEPRWSELFILMGRGGGKNGFLAFEDFCLITETNGVPKYHIDICATNEEQAKTTFDDIVGVLEEPKNTKKLKRFFKWNQEVITNLKTGSQIKYRTNNAKGKDGLRSGKVDFDEIHAYTNWENLNVFTTGLGKKRLPKKTYVTTNGDVRDAPLDELIKKSKAILKGEIFDNGFLPFVCTLDDEKEVYDVENWDKANPSLRYLPTLKKEMLREFEDYKLDPNVHRAFMVKRMNMIVGNTDVQVASWEDILATNKPIPKLEGKTCVLGIDFSKTTDFLGASLLFKVDDKYYSINHAWFCANSDDKFRIKIDLKNMEERGFLTIVNDVEINPKYLTDWILEQQHKYNITKICIDNFRYSFLSMHLQKIGFEPKINIKMVRPSDVMKVHQKVHSAFINKKIVWGDNPLMRWFTNNTKCVPAPNNNFTFAKIEPKSRKTDGFMAFVHAMTCEEELETNEQTFIYDSFVF